MRAITIYGLTALLLVGLTTSVLAQQSMPPMTPEQREAMRKAEESRQAIMRSSPAIQQSLKHRINQELIAHWNDNASIVQSMNILGNDDLRVGLGISEEQRQEIQDAMRHISTLSFVDGRMVANDPDIQLIWDEKSKLGDPYAENTSEETRMAIFDLQWIYSETVMRKREDIINENLTPDQLQRVKEFQISAMSEIALVSPGMFEALHLSDEQKGQLGEIKQELDTDFQKLMDRRGYVRSILSEKLTEEFNKSRDVLAGIVPNTEEWNRLTKDIGKNVREANPELFREMLEAEKSIVVFSDALKVGMFDVLTDEQWARMTDLIDNPPDYVRRWLTQVREANAVAERDFLSGDGWVPGPNSWQPGDPIPEAYRIERNTRLRQFPRGE
jgi:hypothetical protein